MMVSNETMTDAEVMANEMALSDLYNAFETINAQEFDGQLDRPLIKIRRMARSQGFYRAKPDPTIVINERLATNNWPKTLQVFKYCMVQQFHAQAGRKGIQTRIAPPVEVVEASRIDSKTVSAPSLSRDTSNGVKSIPEPARRQGRRNSAVQPAISTAMVPDIKLGDSVPRVKPHAGAIMVELVIQIPKAQLDALRQQAYEKGIDKPVVFIRGNIE